MLNKIQGKWLVLSGLVLVIGAALFVFGACASTDAQSDTTVMAKAKINPCNPCAAKNPCNPCNPCKAKNP
ncbi:MAG: hypothetical protein ETSY1_36325, partial [Candidatus Entotheonella factor]